MAIDATIRRANISDAIPILNCVKAAYQHYIVRIGKPPGPMLDDYHKIIQQHLVHVAEVEIIIGVLVLIQTQSGMLLDNVAIHPQHQGKGLGVRLLTLAETEARNRGFEYLELYTHESMTENIALYKALGYGKTNRKKVDGYNRIYMKKSLL